MDILSFAFMQKALAAGALIFIITGFISFFVVNKDLAFIGTGIAHITFGGLAFGLLINVNPFISGVIFALTAAFFIAKLSYNKKISSNNMIGVFLSFSMAAGIIFIKLSHSVKFDVFSYLFGSIISLSYYDLIILSILTVFLIVFFTVFFQQYMLILFDPIFGLTQKLRVKLLHTLLILIIAVVIVSLVKIIGIILVEGLLVLPGLSAYFIAKNYRQQLFFSFVFSFISVFAGIFISASSLSLPSGASIIMVAFFIFLITLFFRKN